MGIWRKIKKVAEKAYSDVSNTAENSYKYNVYATKAAYKAGTLDFKGAGNEFMKIGDMLGLTPQGDQMESELDLASPDTAAIEAQNKKKLQDMARLNSPGLSSQSVLNLR